MLFECILSCSPQAQISSHENTVQLLHLISEEKPTYLQAILGELFHYIHIYAF